MNPESIEQTRTRLTRAEEAAWSAYTDTKTEGTNAPATDESQQAFDEWQSAARAKDQFEQDQKAIAAAAKKAAAKKEKK